MGRGDCQSQTRRQGRQADRQLVTDGLKQPLGKDFRLCAKNTTKRWEKYVIRERSNQFRGQRLENLESNNGTLRTIEQNPIHPITEHSKTLKQSWCFSLQNLLPGRNRCV